MNLYVFLGGVGLAIAVFFGGVHVGKSVEALDRAQERATELDHVVKVQQIVIKEVPKIVTKTVTKEVTIEKEVERVVVAANSMLAPDCVMPHNYGVLLVAAANGLDPNAPGVADDLAGTYGCRETLEAVLKDLRAGWRNTARLEGLQQFEKLVSSSTTNEGRTP